MNVSFKKLAVLIPITFPLSDNWSFANFFFFFPDKMSGEKKDSEITVEIWSL